MSFSVFALILAVLLLASGLLGILLIRRGLRGQRVGDHPVCRKCGFDLFGLPDDHGACPECGADIRARGAVLTGHRQRRMPSLYAGLALLSLALLIGGSAGYAVSSKVDWQRVKPDAWLTWEARGGAAPAWTELGRRVTARSISGERAQALMANALAWQKDLARTWMPAVGDFVEAARAAKLITNEQWMAYARQAPQPSLVWRAKVRRGDSLPGTIAFGPSRAGTSSKLSVRIEKPLDTDEPLAIPPRKNGGSGAAQLSLSGTGSTGISLPLDPRSVEAAPLGKRTTTVKLTAELRESWDAPGIEWMQDVAADWELVAKDAPTVELVPDSPKLRQQIEAALKVDKLELQAPSPGSDYTSISLELKIGALPVPLSYDIYFRSGDREWKHTTIAVAGATHYSMGGFLEKKQKFDARRVDVIFRPSPKAPYESVNITRMWNGEIIVPDVEVKWPATQRTTPTAKNP